MRNLSEGGPKGVSISCSSTAVKPSIWYKPLPPMIPIRMSVSMFYQLQKDAVRRGRMHERYPGVVRARSRRGVDQPSSGSLETLQCFFNIVHTDRNVMNALTPFRHELFDGRLGRFRLEQFDAAVANRKHGDTNALIV